ncbi:MAG TPA: hypothetical protein VN634_20530 [Candidatus Limnocylindrales bacterium]|nr:hypothetical protein [Candidatus Limnocylindrales bacterium]
MVVFSYIVPMLILAETPDAITVLMAAAALATILPAVARLYRWLRPEPGALAPVVVATVDWESYVIAPDVKKQLRESVPLEDLVSWEKRQREFPSVSSDELLERFSRSFTSAEAIASRQTRYLYIRWELELAIVVRNDSNVVASAAKLLLPGDGVAVVSRTILFRDSPLVEWKGEIALGDILPNSAVRLRVWKADLFFDATQLSQFAVVYDGGLGKVINQEMTTSPQSWFGLGTLFWISVGGLVLMVLSLVGLFLFASH